MNPSTSLRHAAAALLSAALVPMLASAPAAQHPQAPTPTRTGVPIAPIAAPTTWSLQSAAARTLFTADPDVGVRLDEIGERSLDPTGGTAIPAFRNSLPPQFRHLSGLWEIHGTHELPPAEPCKTCDRIGPNEFCIKPNGKPFFMDTSVPNQLTLVWPKVPIPGAAIDEKDLRVEVRVRLDPNDRVTRWWPTVKRVNGTATRASIDEIHCPILYVEPPIRHRLTLQLGGGATRLETEQEAQARARILVPNNNINVGFQGGSTANTPLLSTNLPLDYWFRAFPSEYFELDHPNPGQLLQFQAVYNADSADRGFRSLLYLGAEDARGYKKRFGYRAVSFRSSIYPTEPNPGPQQPQTADWRWTWRHIYLPPFEDMIGAPGVMDEWGNTFVAPYPAVIGVLHARSDDFWYDAAEFYRGFVASSGMFATTFENNPVVSDAMRDQAVFSAHALVDPTQVSGSILPRALSIARAYRAYLNQASPFALTTTHFLWFGNYRSDRTYGYPDFPVDVAPELIIPTLAGPGFIDPALAPTVSLAHALGIHTGGYTEGLCASMASGWPVPEDAWLYDRAGNRVDGTSYFVDFGNFDAGSSGITTWFSQGVGPEGTGMNGMGRLVAEATGFRGLYVDGVAGSGFTMGYPDPEDPGALGHTPHGGDYVTRGRNKVLRDARAMLRSLPQNQGHEDQVFLISEATQEGITDLDLLSQGLDYVPYHMALFEPTWFASPLSGLGDIEQHMVGVPLASRAWSVPLWNTVYHQYQPASSLVMAITTAGIAGGPLYPSGQGPCFRAGVSPAQWEDELSFAFAAFWISGQKPMCVPYMHDFDFSPLWCDVSGALQWNDPTGACGRALDFIARMHALYVGKALRAANPGWAGRFNLFGEAQRPLRTANNNPTRGNPTHPVYQNTQASLPPSCTSGQLAQHSSVVLPFMEQSVNVHAVLAHLLDHPVPAVLHSVWRHDTGGSIAGFPAPGQPPRIGILLANWTDAAQTWTAVLEPSLYGIPPGTPYTVREIDPLGNPIATIGTAMAPAPLAIAKTMPARNDPIDRRAVTVLTVGP
jgi:hypothetical protein